MSQGKPLVLLPCEPFDPRQIDPDFEPERRAAKSAGLETALVDHSRVLEGAAAAAVGRTPEGAGAAIYRGWMLRPNQYAAMHAALLSRGIALINTPEEYRTCHYLPESYPWIVELGDGQVAGLPSADLASEFYRQLGQPS